jgi:hypothetical protein
MNLPGSIRKRLVVCGLVGGIVIGGAIAFRRLSPPENPGRGSGGIAGVSEQARRRGAGEATRMKPGEAERRLGAIRPDAASADASEIGALLGVLFRRDCWAGLRAYLVLEGRGAFSNSAVLWKALEDVGSGGLEELLEAGSGADFGSDRDRLVFIACVVGVLAGKDSVAAKDWLEKHRDIAAGDLARPVLASGLGRFAPMLGAEWLGDRKTFPMWAPVGDFARGLAARLRETGDYGEFGEVAEMLPPKNAEMLARDMMFYGIGEGTPADYRDFLDALGSAGLPESALGELKDEALGSAARMNPEFAKEWLDRFGPEDADFSCVVRGYAKRDAARACKWIVEWNGRGGDVLNDAVRLWLGQDSLRASRWIEGLPDGEAKDRSVFEMASWLAEKGDFDMAKSWAGTIRGTEWKTRAGKALGENGDRAGPGDR